MKTQWFPLWIFSIVLLSFCLNNYGVAGAATDKKEKPLSGKDDLQKQLQGFRNEEQALNGKIFELETLLSKYQKSENPQYWDVKRSLAREKDRLRKVKALLDKPVPTKEEYMLQKLQRLSEELAAQRDEMYSIAKTLHQDMRKVASSQRALEQQGTAFFYSVPPVIPKRT